MIAVAASSSTGLPPAWALLCYILAITLFARGIKLLTSPRTAVLGNRVAGLGMLLAIGVTLGLLHVGWAYIVPAAAIGAVIGATWALRVPMTAMPQMVAMFNGMGGGAAALVALGDFHRLTAGGATLGLIDSGTILLSCLIGSISFAGSMIAFAKLQEIMTGTPITWPLQHEINGVWLLGLLVIGSIIMATGGGGVLMIVFFAGALILGVMAVLPVGGADMPVIISLLNAFTGVAAAVTGFVIGNYSLVVAGALVGASGSILTLLMSRAMNRPISNVLFGAFGKVAEGVGGGAAAVAHAVRPTTAEDLAVLLSYAQQVIFVPGYGLAVARAQHEVKELADQLKARGVRVLYAIHPVAGRMPGHMNVLLAEADVPYDELKEMDSVNPEFPRTDVAVVIGANDVVNPAALNDPKSPIWGMPILRADQAKTVVVLKRSMRPGFAGIENELFYHDNTLMLFGDAKDSVTKLIAEVKQQAAA
ncbi:MAG TPA: NAD(P)(+) transhydrogenase (Re/Si-specific) subunit beta [Candidatus Binatia bacterium]|nr:NAD(P)(+) transhydrogenase (Re/Si-specific) subunit beta [Candidatus Binatia bacterium]